MTNRWKRICLAAATAVVVIAVTAIVLVRVPGYGPKDWLAAYLLGHLQSVPDELVAVEMRKIAALDEAGLFILMDALASPRPSVADAAVAALHEQLDVWKQLPRDRSSRPVAIVARGLARRVDCWPAAPRCAAADLVLRILDWPIDDRQVPRATLLADCEHVLRTQQGPTASTAGRRATTPPASVADAASQEALRGAPSPANASWATSSLPGGDMPVAEVELPSLPTSLAIVPEPRLPQEREPRLLPTRERGLSGRSSSGEATLPDQPAPTGTPPTPSQLWTPPSDAAISIRPLSGTNANDMAADLGTDLETRSDLELIRSLDAHDPDLTRQVEAVLQRRGFRKIDLALAHQLANPDVTARRELVESVGRLPGGAGRWLIWLSHDPDSTVRKAAVSLMVTAQDPSVQHRLLIMENMEADEEVREQLRRWREMQQ